MSQNIDIIYNRNNIWWRLQTVKIRITYNHTPELLQKL